MFYKINLNQIRTFLEVSILGVILSHDSYHALLAIASCMLAYFFSLSLFSSKIVRLIAFCLLSIVFCQLSVTIKKAVLEEGFRQTAIEQPIGVLFSDAVYGVKAVIATIGKLTGAFYKAWTSNEYSSLESLNYRFFTILIMMLILGTCILFKPTIKFQKVKEEIRVAN